MGQGLLAMHLVTFKCQLMIKEAKHKCLLFNNNKSLNNVLLPHRYESPIDLQIFSFHNLPHPPPLSSYLAKLVQYRKAKTWAPINYISIVYGHCFFCDIRNGKGRCRQVIGGSRECSSASCLFRYVAAGVLSKCVQSKDGCCLDPVVYHKLNTEIKWWIWSQNERMMR